MSKTSIPCPDGNPDCATLHYKEAYIEELDEILDNIQGDWEVYLDNRDNAKSRLIQLIESEKNRARIDELEMLAEMTDQELDPDGRPLTPPYKLINEHTEYVIEERLNQLKEEK